MSHVLMGHDTSTLRSPRVRSHLPHMSHVTCSNESCDICKWVVTYMRMTEEHPNHVHSSYQCTHVSERVRTHLRTGNRAIAFKSRICVMTHTQTSCATRIHTRHNTSTRRYPSSRTHITHKQVMPRIQMSQHEPRHTYTQEPKPSHRKSILCYASFASFPPLLFFFCKAHIRPLASNSHVH